jgi:hypothetical protein
MCIYTMITHTCICVYLCIYIYVYIYTNIYVSYANIYIHIYIYGSVRASTPESFSQDDARFQTSTSMTSRTVIYYILRSGIFAAACLQDTVKAVLDPRLPWADTNAVQTSRTRRPSPRIQDGEGVVTPRSTTDSTEQWV